MNADLGLSETLLLVRCSALGLLFALGLGLGPGLCSALPTGCRQSHSPSVLFHHNSGHQHWRPRRSSLTAAIWGPGPCSWPVQQGQHIRGSSSSSILPTHPGTWQASNTVYYSHQYCPAHWVLHTRKGLFYQSRSITCTTACKRPLTRVPRNSLCRQHFLNQKPCWTLLRTLHNACKDGHELRFQNEFRRGRGEEEKKTLAEIALTSERWNFRVHLFSFLFLNMTFPPKIILLYSETHE